MASKEFLKGIAKLRRAYTSTDYETVDAMECRDRWGDRFPMGTIIKVPKDRNLDGLEKLGNGAYSTVYAIDEKRVLKVSKGRDVGYDKFAVLAMCNQHNPHFPRIFYRGVWGTDFVYVIERLCEGTHYNERRELENAIYSAPSLGKYLTISDPYVKEIAHLLNHFGLTGDIGGNNVLCREDGTPVVSDPAAQGREDTGIDPLRSWKPSPPVERAETLGDILVAALRR